MNNLQRWLLARLPRPLVVLLLITGNVLIAAGVLRWLYVSVGDELPKREKKK